MAAEPLSDGGPGGAPGLCRTNSRSRAQGLAAFLLRPQDEALSNERGLEPFELRLRSQNGEDGILYYIFRKIGAASKTFVEFGIQDGRECNCAHLALSMGWRGLFIEQNRKSAELASDYYQRMLRAGAHRIQILNATVTPENINGLISSAGLAEVDLLSIDIDSYDYWIWKAVETHAPVVVIEYNAIFGPDRSITVPYGEPKVSREWHYHGASLAALARIGSDKDYALVGCDSAGINAFFVRTTLLREGLRELNVRDAYRPHAGLTRTMTVDQQFDKVKHLPFVEVR